jgi:hypothetical protein
MATVLVGFIIEKQCSHVRFLWTEGVNLKDIHSEIFPLYGWKCLSCKAVHNWVETFSQGRSKVADDALPRPHVEVATEASVKRLEELILADRRIKIGSVASVLGRSYGLAYSIVHDTLTFRKVCAGWVPRELKEE